MPGHRAARVTGEGLAPGEEIGFRLPLLARSRAIPQPSDGSAWIHVDDFSSLPIVEVFLDGRPPDLTLSEASLCRALAAATDQPTQRRPTAQEVESAIVQEHGTGRALLIDAPVARVAALLEAQGAVEVQAQDSGQAYALQVCGGRACRWEVVDFQEWHEDPETFYPTAAGLLRSALEALGAPPRTICFVHGFPESEELTRRVIAEILERYPGLLIVP